jgi:hypothetical protein
MKGEGDAKGSEGLWEKPGGSAFRGIIEKKHI